MTEAKITTRLYDPQWQHDCLGSDVIYMMAYVHEHAPIPPSEWREAHAAWHAANHPLTPETLSKYHEGEP